MHTCLRSCRHSTRMSMRQNYGHLQPAPSTEIHPTASSEYDPSMEGRDSFVKVRPSDEFDLNTYSKRMGGLKSKRDYLVKQRK